MAHKAKTNQIYQCRAASNLRVIVGKKVSGKIFKVFTNLSGVLQDWELGTSFFAMYELVR